MKLLSTLIAPFKDVDKEKFIETYAKGTNIIQQMPNGNLEAWAYTQEDEVRVILPKENITPEEELQRAREYKTDEANLSARYFLEQGVALFELSTDFHVAATKENMNTLANAANSIEKGFQEAQEWTSEEDTTRLLTKDECIAISLGIGAIQSDVWNRQFKEYLMRIKEAENIKELDDIQITYSVAQNGGA